MHDIVMNELEKHFTGDAPQAFYDHLDACPQCREAVSDMDRVMLALRELRPDSAGAPEPRLGFYNRVVGDIVEHQHREAWGLFSPGAAFFRRIAFASLLVLAGLGGFLVNRENVDSGADAVAIFSEHDANHDVSADRSPGPERDRILVTLASYNRE